MTTGTTDLTQGFGVEIGPADHVWHADETAQPGGTECVFMG